MTIKRITKLILTLIIGFFAAIGFKVTLAHFGAPEYIHDFLSWLIIFLTIQNAGFFKRKGN